MIRPTSPEDRNVILEMTEGTKVFHAHEIEALGEVLDDYHAMNQRFEHRASTMLDGDSIIGFAYYAPVAMTVRTWELWWIVVAKQLQGHGLGKLLLDAVESEVLTEQGRLLLIDTSSLPHYEPTRQFYRKRGYEFVAALPRFLCRRRRQTHFSEAYESTACINVSPRRASGAKRRSRDALAERLLKFEV